MIRSMLVVVSLVTLVPGALAQQASKQHEFKENKTGTPGLSRGVSESRIEPSATETVLKFTVVDKDTGPVPGVVMSLTGPNGKAFYTEETDAKGYAEVLVPAGQNYDLVYLSLDRSDVSAKVPVDDKPNQTIRLTLRYKRHQGRKKMQGEGGNDRFVLSGIEFDSGKSTLRADSLPRLDTVVEYMAHKKSARIEISGHTDNVGNAKQNKRLSQARADACRKYLMKQGIDGSRIKAVGYGDEHPIAPNDTDAGRQANRRIEATEL